MFVVRALPCLLPQVIGCSHYLAFAWLDGRAKRKLRVCVNKGHPDCFDFFRPGEQRDTRQVPRKLKLPTTALFQLLPCALCDKFTSPGSSKHRSGQGPRSKNSAAMAEAAPGPSLLWCSVIVTHPSLGVRASQSFLLEGVCSVLSGRGR